MSLIPSSQEDPLVSKAIACNTVSTGEMVLTQLGQARQAPLIPGHLQEITLLELEQDVQQTPVLFPLGLLGPQFKSQIVPSIISRSLL